MTAQARKSIGIRELRAKAGRVVRRVKQKREAVDITYRGEVVARLVPVESAADADAHQSATWDDIDRLAAEIGKHLKPGGKSAAELISEDRR
jgi:prevent-host-death family protein